jgi:hypothetical protein
MPCYTLVTVEVKDLAAAQEALKRLGIKASITKNSNGTYTITPESPRADFRDRFNEEYSVALATKKAKAAGYTVTRKEIHGETQLVLRQY